jgi:dipeptide/tripeptide permease
VFSILGVPVVFAVWRWHAEARAGVEPGDLEKIGMGAWLVASANVILVAAILTFGNDGLSPIWPFLYFAMMGLAFLFYWPVTLALVSRAAPAPVNATMMGVAFLTLFAASNILAASADSMKRCRPRCSGACTPVSRRRAAWGCSCSAARLRAFSGPTLSRRRSRVRNF